MRNKKLLCVSLLAALYLPGACFASAHPNPREEVAAAVAPIAENHEAKWGTQDVWPRLTDRVAIAAYLPKLRAVDEFDNAKMQFLGYSITPLLGMRGLAPAPSRAFVVRVPQ